MRKARVSSSIRSESRNRSIHRDIARHSLTLGRRVSDGTLDWASFEDVMRRLQKANVLMARRAFDQACAELEAVENDFGLQT